MNKIQSEVDKDSNDPFGEVNYGNALRYGKFVVSSVAVQHYDPELETNEFSYHGMESVKKIKPFIEYMENREYQIYIYIYL